MDTSDIWKSYKDTREVEDVDRMSIKELVDFLEYVYDNFNSGECQEICDVPPYTNCPICTAAHGLNGAAESLREAAKEIRDGKCVGQNSKPFQEA